MPTIHTHIRPDLDALASVWAVRKYVFGFANAPVRFHSADWDGAGMAEGDIAVDIEAGGRGIKGRKDGNLVHSCFETIIARYAPTDEQSALAELVEFVDTQDTFGSALDHLVPGASERAQAVLGTNSLGSVLRAIQRMNSGNTDAVVAKMSEIFEGLRRSGRGRRAAENEAEEGDIDSFGGGRVLVARNLRYAATPRVLFSRGARVLIFFKNNGSEFGLLRHKNESLRMDHPRIRQVVEEAGERVSSPGNGGGEGEWFSHTGGFIFAWGTQKAPAQSRSAVNPEDLARAAVEALGEHHSS